MNLGVNQATGREAQQLVSSSNQMQVSVCSITFGLLGRPISELAKEFTVKFVANYEKLYRHLSIFTDYCEVYR